MDSWLLCYDIADPKRLARVRKIAYAYALGGQKSALEVPLDKQMRNELLERLEQAIDPEVDKVNLIRYWGEPVMFGVGIACSLEEGMIVL